MPRMHRGHRQLLEECPLTRADRKARDEETGSGHLPRSPPRVGRRLSPRVDIDSGFPPLTGRGRSRKGRGSMARDMADLVRNVGWAGSGRWRGSRCEYRSTRGSHRLTNDKGDILPRANAPLTPPHSRSQPGRAPPLETTPAASSLYSNEDPSP